MIRTITIEGYRGLKRFSLRELGRINLLLGKNSAGKTSLLEAIELFAAEGEPTVLGDILWRREETSLSGKFGSLKSLFYGYGVCDGRAALLTGQREGGSAGRVPIEIVETDDDTLLHMNGHKITLDETLRFPISTIRQRARRKGIRSSSTFLTTGALTTRQFIRLLDEVLLTDGEALFLEAVQYIDPSIKRIAALSEGDSESRKVFAQIKSTSMRVPLRSLGDGVWRLGALALSLNSARGGVLLVDEIDSGLHYSVMKSMWRMIIKSARRLGVQVFATTHSQDCVEALAAVCEALQIDDVMVQRIKAGRVEAIAYNADALIRAVERDVEVR